MFKKALLIAVFSVASVLAYSYTCFPPLANEGEIAINPVLFMDDNNSGGMETFFYYGLTDKFDISTSILTVGGTSDFSAMLRYGLCNDYKIGIKANASLAIPQLSFDWEDDLFIFQSMVATQFVYDYSNKPAIYGSFCPGYKISDIINICVDLNPGYYLQDGDFANYAVREKGFGFDIAPSLGFAVGDCLFSIALPIYNVQKDAQVTFGAWLYYGTK
jgi:hypothetical protein